MKMMAVDSYYNKPGMANIRSRFQRYRIRNLFRLYQPEPADRVLDIGCGWGTITFALSSKVHRVIGIDNDPESIEICRKNYPACEFIEANAYNLPFSDESFDVVIMFDFIEHIPNFNGTSVAINEANRVLRPGGKLIIWTPCRSHFLEILKNNNIILKKDESHVGYETMYNLISILHYGGYRIKKAYYWGSHLRSLFIFEYLLRFIPLFRRRIAILSQREA
jgi:ubiquinone/menaquinone biosynthesis C-methylase UbiE